MDPVGAVGRETTGWNDTVDVRMTVSSAPRYARQKGSRCQPPTKMLDERAIGCSGQCENMMTVKALGCQPFFHAQRVLYDIQEFKRW